MNHETFQFNFAALDSKPAAEVLCAQLDAECATCVKRFASTRLRLLNRLTVTRCYLRNLPMLWLPKFLPTKVYGSCHRERDRQKVFGLLWWKCSCLGVLSYPAVWLVRLAPRDASVIDIKACNRRSWSSWCGVHWIDPKWTKRRLFITLMTKIHLTLLSCPKVLLKLRFLTSKMYSIGRAISSSSRVWTTTSGEFVYQISALCVDSFLRHCLHCLSSPYSSFSSGNVPIFSRSYICINSLWNTFV